MILSSLPPRVSQVVRLIALVFIGWSVIAGSPPPGTHGRELVVLVLFAIVVAAWLFWVLDPGWEGPLRIDTWVMALAGGVLVGAAPSSASSGFVFAAVVTAGLRTELTRALQVAAAGAFTLAVSVIVWDGTSLGLLAYALGFAAATLGASNARQSKLRAAQAELLLAQSQRSHEEQLRAARLQESTRLAREIHDVLAHSLAGLSIQLEATSALIEAGADRDEILTRVRRAHELARDGLRETRRAVGALRGVSASVPEAIEALAAGYHDRDGAPARVAITGDPARLTGDAGQAVLRVVQEALTNVTKHAAGAPTAIEIDVDDGAIAATVVNEGAPVPVGAGSLSATGGGYGLVGMRERAQALHGTLQAGPAGADGGDPADSGWRVALRIPPDRTHDGPEPPPGETPR